MYLEGDSRQLVAKTEHQLPTLQRHLKFWGAANKRVLIFTQCWVWSWTSVVDAGQTSKPTLSQSVCWRLYSPNTGSMLVNHSCANLVFYALWRLPTNPCDRRLKIQYTFITQCRQRWLKTFCTCLLSTLPNTAPLGGTEETVTGWAV